MKHTATLLTLSLVCGAAAAVEPCRIEVVEKGSGWPVPLVELRTTHQVRFVTDNAGVIAFDLPELMGRETWFDVAGHGYEAAKDGFGYRGVRLTPEPGKTLRGGGASGPSSRAAWGGSRAAGCLRRARRRARRATPSSRAWWAATRFRTPSIADACSGCGATPPWPSTRWASSTAPARRRPFSRWRRSNRRCG